MKTQLTSEELIKLLVQVCRDMEARQDELQELDSQAGDGDLGVTIKLGCAAAAEMLSGAGGDIGAFLAQAGTAFNKAAASTFGTLMAIALLRAGGVARGKQVIELQDAALMVQAALAGIVQRGGAAAGERTMLDALIPACAALEECAREGSSFGVAAIRTADAAEQGAQATATMAAKHGRAGWMGSKSAGVPDAGATAIALMFESLAGHLNSTEKPGPYAS